MAKFVQNKSARRATTILLVFLIFAAAYSYLLLGETRRKEKFDLLLNSPSIVLDTKGIANYWIFDQNFDYIIDSKSGTVNPFENSAAPQVNEQGINLGPFRKSFLMQTENSGITRVVKAERLSDNEVLLYAVITTSQTPKPDLNYVIQLQAHTAISNFLKDGQQAYKDSECTMTVIPQNGESLLFVPEYNSVQIRKSFTDKVDFKLHLKFDC